MGPISLTLGISTLVATVFDFVIPGSMLFVTGKQSKKHQQMLKALDDKGEYEKLR